MKRCAQSERRKKSHTYSQVEFPTSRINSMFFYHNIAVCYIVCCCCCCFFSSDQISNEAQSYSETFPKSSRFQCYVGAQSFVFNFCCCWLDARWPHRVIQSHMELCFVNSGSHLVSAGCASLICVIRVQAMRYRITNTQSLLHAQVLYL